MENDRIESLILAKLKEVVEVLDIKAPETMDSNTRIFGVKGMLDSMALVTLITDLEEGIEEEFEIYLILADDRAMSQKKSPFRSVSALTEYVSMLIKEEKGQ